eukprot:TRINITY_DN1780_c0_g1_i2.p1 TRINITY_DN1780_c0_g1~~TRINITY_DN1780_c0_g1_i2.p1  ORF type:complete len:204 (+),score=25.87 TRINITY_DN1780_c0_g1_i2:154-765(+)
MIADVLADNRSKIHNFRKINLSLCYQITDATLSLMLGFPALHTLVLAGCFNITDKAMDHISTMQNLSNLNLYRCANLTDDGIRKLIKSPLRLQNLNLAHCYNITDAAFENITEQQTLTELNLRYTKLTDMGLNYLSALKNLKKLILYYCENITKDAVKRLQMFPKLEEVNCRYTKVKAGGGVVFTVQNLSAKDQQIKIIAGDK